MYLVLKDGGPDACYAYKNVVHYIRQNHVKLKAICIKMQPLGIHEYRADAIEENI